MKKFFVDFSATMIVSANNREEAELIFWDKIYNKNTNLSFVETEYIGEDEEDEEE